MGKIEVFKVHSLSFGEVRSLQLDDDIVAFFQRHGIALPNDNRREILNYIKLNSAHAASLEKRSKMVLGYHFQDESKAGNARELLDNLSTKSGNHISFTQLNQKMLYMHNALSFFMLEIARVGDKVANLFLTNSADIYDTIDRSYYWQILPNGREQKFTRYRKKESGMNELIGNLDGDMFNSYYPTPHYFSAINAMKLNRLYQQSNEYFFENSSNIDLAIIIEGGDISKEDRECIKRALDSNYTAIKNSHKTVILPTNEGRIRIQRLDSIQRDAGFIEDRQLNDQEVILAHGMPSELLNYFKGGGLGSGDKYTGALKVYLQTEVKPALNMLEAFWNRFLYNEVSGYDTKIIFKTLDLTDELEDSKISDVMADTYIKLKTLKDFTLFNEHRSRNNLSPFTLKEFQEFIKEDIPDVQQVTVQEVKETSNFIKAFKNILK